MAKFTHVIQVYKTPIYKRHVPYAVKAGIGKKEFAEVLLKCLQNASKPEALANNSTDVLTSKVMLPWADFTREQHQKFGVFMESIVAASVNLSFPNPL